MIRFAVKRREFNADDEKMWADIEKNFSGQAIECVAAMYADKRA
jgi:hypothetical protein